MDLADSQTLSRRRGQLLHRIARKYDIVTEELTIGPLRFPFTRVRDADAVLDQVAAAEDRLERLSGRRTPSDQLHLPYWAELWDSAFGVAEYLVAGKRRSDEATKRRRELSPIANDKSKTPAVLDLGCGMGLAGTAAAYMGFDVTFADLEPDALLLARLNSLPRRRQCRTRKLDWRCDRLHQRFNLILGADILYERTQWQYLEPFWREHLAPDGCVLLGEPGRQTGELFLEWIRPLQWDLQVREQPIPSRPKPIRLFELRMKS